MTIDREALPRPATIETEDGTVLRLGNWKAGAILLQERPDAQLAPLVLTLVYGPSSPRAKLNAVEAHYTQHHQTDFSWTLPGESQPRRWIYREPTSITFDNPAFGSARAFLEEALAHD